ATDGQRILTIPRASPINAITMGGIVRDQGSPLGVSQAAVDEPPHNKRLELMVASRPQLSREAVRQNGGHPGGRAAFPTLPTSPSVDRRCFLRAGSIAGMRPHMPRIHVTVPEVVRRSGLVWRHELPA
ncbi:MAG: hypothetical protein ACRD1T_05410, partial [Acidimicrobiia bacterium]